mgnify:CR=1 FL=1
MFVVRVLKGNSNHHFASEEAVGNNYVILEAKFKHRVHQFMAKNSIRKTCVVQMTGYVVRMINSLSIFNTWTFFLANETETIEGDAKSGIGFQVLNTHSN